MPIMAYIQMRLLSVMVYMRCPHQLELRVLMACSLSGAEFNILLYQFFWQKIQHTFKELHCASLIHTWLLAWLSVIKKKSVEKINFKIHVFNLRLQLEIIGYNSITAIFINIYIICFSPFLLMLLRLSQVFLANSLKP